MKKQLSLILFNLLIFASLSAHHDLREPDYTQKEDWVALPGMEDYADLLPENPSLKDGQETAKADVFFVYPTIYDCKNKRQDDCEWNASLDDEDLNKEINESTIKNQATIFNGAGRVYIPRYRQMKFSGYYHPDTQKMKESLEFAYKDVKKAFKFYLDHYNQGRPIIIAAHSQGTQHATALLKEFFDGQELQDNLVAAYLVGMPIKESTFSSIGVCENPDETGCFVSWNTWRWGINPHEGKDPDFPNYYDGAVCVNPITWSRSEKPVAADQNLGGILRNFKKVIPQVNDAKIQQGVLWTNKPKVFGKAFLTMKNFHIADYNFYWMNVRANVKERVDKFLNNASTTKPKE